MFQHILVPLDFTQKNAAALEAARRLAQQNRSRVTLLHVIETIEYAEDEEIEAFYDTLRERVAAELNACGESFRDAGVPIDELIVLGKAGRGIVEYAMTNDVDLVVLSSHRVHLDRPPEGWATLSYQVSILCQCPVMLVK